MVDRDIMPHIRRVIHNSVLSYFGNVKNYTKVYKKQLERQIDWDLNQGALDKPAQDELKALAEEKQMLSLQYRLDTDRVRKITALLEMQ